MYRETGVFDREILVITSDFARAEEVFLAQGCSKIQPGTRGEITFALCGHPDIGSDEGSRAWYNFHQGGASRYRIIPNDTDCQVLRDALRVSLELRSGQFRLFVAISSQDLERTFVFCDFSKLWCMHCEIWNLSEEI